MKVEPSNPTNQQALGDLYLTANRTEEACQVLQSLLEKPDVNTPMQHAMRRKLAGIYLDRGKSGDYSLATQFNRSIIGKATKN